VVSGQWSVASHEEQLSIAMGLNTDNWTTDHQPLLYNCPEDSSERAQFPEEGPN